MSDINQANGKPTIIVTFACDKEDKELVSVDGKGQTNKNKENETTKIIEVPAIIISYANDEPKLLQKELLDGPKKEKKTTKENQVQPSTSRLSPSQHRRKESMKVLPLLPEKPYQALDDESKRRLELSRILKDYERTSQSERHRSSRKKSSTGSLFRWDSSDYNQDPVLGMATRLQDRKDSTKTADALREMTLKELDDAFSPTPSRKSSISMLFEPEKEKEEKTANDAKPEESETQVTEVQIVKKKRKSKLSFLYRKK